VAESDAQIIIKRIKKHRPEHHGGAWKIAYADFVTAMMAFFLLLWLISMTTPQQKIGLADYFAPPNESPTLSGAGGIMAGKSPSDSGAQKGASSSNISAAGSLDAAKHAPNGNAKLDTKGSSLDESAEKDMGFHSAAVSIKQAWHALPQLTDVADNLLVEETPEGLNIQLVEQSGQRMFPEGSKYPLEATRQAIAAIAPILQQLPNQITISGHTAAGVKYNNPRYGAWDLSSDRANVVRDILTEFGLSDDHIYSVVGRATQDPFFPDDPYLAANERVKITVMRAAPPIPADLKP